MTKGIVLSSFLVCDYFTHEECREFSVSDCKKCASYVPHIQKVQYLHVLHCQYVKINIFLKEESIRDSFFLNPGEILGLTCTINDSIT